MGASASQVGSGHLDQAKLLGLLDTIRGMLGPADASDHSEQDALKDSPKAPASNETHKAPASKETRKAPASKETPKAILDQTPDPGLSRSLSAPHESDAECDHEDEHEAWNQDEAWYQDEAWAWDQDQAWDQDSQGEQEAEAEEMEEVEASAKVAVAQQQAFRAERAEYAEAERIEKAAYEKAKAALLEANDREEALAAIKRLQASSNVGGDDLSEAPAAAAPAAAPADVPVPRAGDDDTTIVNSTTHKKEYMRLVAWLLKVPQWLVWGRGSWIDSHPLSFRLLG